jgi:hypothetical protein
MNTMEAISTSMTGWDPHLKNAVEIFVFCYDPYRDFQPYSLN